MLVTEVWVKKARLANDEPRCMGMRPGGGGAGYFSRMNMAMGVPVNSH